MPRPDWRDPKLEQFWRTMVAKWIKSQLTIRDFCRKHRLQEPSFYHWRREIASRDNKPIPTQASSTTKRRSATSSQPTRSSPPRRNSTSTSRPNFVALRVVADAPLELVLRSGHILRIPPGYDVNHLHAIISALETQPC
jgi:hypothetical protein